MSDITMSNLVHVSSDFPTASFTLSETITCNPTVHLQITNTSTGTSALTSDWSFGDGSTAVNNNNVFTHDYSSTGTFDVCGTFTDNIGCTSSLCKPFTILTDPQATFTTSTTTICANNTLGFTLTTTPAPTAVEWDFEANGTTDATIPNPVHYFQNGGSYPVSCTIHYGNNCSITSTQNTTITVLPELAVNFTADTLQACSFPLTVNFTNLTTGSDPINYQWQVNNTNVSTSEDLSYTFNSFGSYNVKLTATNSLGCNEQLTRASYINIAPPTISFSAPATVCTGEPVPLSNIQINSYDAISSYAWDFNEDGIVDATEYDPSYEYTNPGQFHISLTITTTHGCTATYSTSNPINVETAVNTAFTSNTQLSCAGQSIQFCAQEQPGNVYMWNFGDMTGWQIMGSDEDCMVHDYQDTGYFDVQLTVFNGACSQTTVYENYIYITPPVAIFDYALNCDDILTVSFVDMSIEATTLQWDFGDGTPIQTGSNPTHTYATDGDYTVTLTAINDLVGCPDHAMDVVSIHPPITQLSYSNTGGCAPLEVHLGSEADNAQWNITVSNGNSYSMTKNAQGSIWTVQSIQDGVSTTSQIYADEDFWPTITFTENGCYDFTVTATNSFGCSVTETYNDVVCVATNADFANFSSEILSTCDSVTIAFHPAASDLANVIWDFGNNTYSDENEPVKTFSAPYNYGQPLHVTLIAQDAQGCQSTVSRDILIDFPIVPEFTIANNPSCSGDIVSFQNLSNGPAVSYNWTFGDPASGENNTSTLQEPTHIFMGNQANYTVCLSVDNGHGCIRSYCAENGVTVAMPQPDFTFTSNITNCLFGVQFQNTTPGENNNVSWNFGDNQFGTDVTTFHTYPIGVYNVTMTVTNAYGCTDSITVDDILNYGNVIGPYSRQLDETNCVPFDASFQAFNTQDTYFTYFWDFDDGNGDTQGSTTTQHIYNEPGVYCPRIIMTDPNGCAVFIPCEEPIVIDEFTLGYSVPSQICFGDTLDLHATIGDSFQLTNSTEFDVLSGNGHYALFPTETTDYLLTGFMDDCMRKDTVHIQVNALPIVTLNIPTDVCFGDEPILLNGGLPSGSTGAYSVNNQAATVFNPTLPAENLYPVKYTYTDSLGCTSSATQDVFIHALPNVSIAEQADLCENGSSVNLGGGSPFGGTYFIDNTIQTVANPSEIGFGSHTITYSFTDQFGCSSSNSTSLEIRGIPVPDIHFSSSCLNTAVSIHNLSTTPGSVVSSTVWNIDEIGTVTTLSPSNLLFETPGQHSVAATLESAYGCTQTWDSTITLWTLPVASFLTAEGCQNTAIEFINQSSVSVGTITQNEWFAEGNSIIEEDTLSYSFSGWGDLVLTLVVTSENGCTDTTSNTVTVYPLPTATIEVANTCDQDVVNFASNAQIPVGGISTFDWSFGDEYDHINSENASVLFNGPSTYTAILSLESNMGCKSTFQKDVTVYPLPLPDFLIEDQVVCSNESIHLVDMSDIPSPHTLVGWEWKFGGQVVSHTRNPEITFDFPGVWDITLEVRSEAGCVADTVIKDAILINPSPAAGFIIDNVDLSMPSPEVQITNGASADVVAWTYSFGDGNTEHFESGSHLYLETGDFTVTQYVQNNFGCSDRMSMEISVTPHLQVFIPNAFTPDENTHNEVYYPVFYGDELTMYEFQIFDRWGNKVFESNDPKQPWNGTYIDGTQIAPDGSYSWKLTYRGTVDPVIHAMNGSVVLLR
jgi:gliding motility-associated-like protein